MATHGSHLFLPPQWPWWLSCMLQSQSFESRTHRSYFAHRVKPPTQPLTPISSCYIHSTRSSSAAWRMNLVRAGKSVLLYKSAGQFRVMELFFSPPEERVTPRSPHSSITLWFLTLQSPKVFIRISLFLPLSLSHHHTITDGLKGMVHPNIICFFGYYVLTVM